MNTLYIVHQMMYHDDFLKEWWLEQLEIVEVEHIMDGKLWWQVQAIGILTIFSSTVYGP
jgi:hypothetical protein